MSDWNGGYYARNTDPETSHEAAEEVTTSERVRRHKVLLERVFEEVYPEPLIPREAGEAAGLAGLPGDCHWHRVGDLWRAGILDRTGEKRISRKTNSPQNLHVWIPPHERVPTPERSLPVSNPIDFVRWVIAVGEDEEFRRSLTLQDIIDRAWTYLPRDEELP